MIDSLDSTSKTSIPLYFILKNPNRPINFLSPKRMLRNQLKCIDKHVDENIL